MMSPKLHLGLLLLAILVCRAATAQEPAEADPAKTDVAKFAGTWKLASLERDGKKVDPMQSTDVRLIFDANQYTYKAQNGQRDQGTFKIDARKKPHVMETVRADPAAQGKGLKRIYTWVDKDTVKFCSPGPKETLPNDFKAPAGSGRELTVWTREKS